MSGATRRARRVKSQKKQTPSAESTPNPLQTILESLTLIRSTVVTCRAALTFDDTVDGEIALVLQTHVAEELWHQIERLGSLIDGDCKGVP